MLLCAKTDNVQVNGFVGYVFVLRIVNNYLEKNYEES
jgi:hypothetical protein